MALKEDSKSSAGNHYDINGQFFNPDMYLQKMLKENSLKQVMTQESEIVRDTQSLHSEMQTLVYENYNKFISATDTIKKMKTDFKKMENEMDKLAKNMESITSFSDSISSTLQDTRQQISKLSGVHTLLKRLQFLFKLPTKLKVQMQEGNYSEAVRDYLHTQRVLEQYGNLESFEGIQQDCNTILKELMEKLREQFKAKDATAKEVAESIDLLLQLGEPTELLCSEFLSHSECRLNVHLENLKINPGQDIIEFVDLGSNGFLSDLRFVATSFNDMFVHRPTYNDDEMAVKLSAFVKTNMDKYFELVQWRIELEQDVGDTGMLVRALDRFHRRLTGVNSLSSDTDFAMTGTEIVIRAGRRQCRSHLHALKAHLADSLTSVRQGLAAPRLTVTETSNSALSSELLTSLMLATVEKVKGVLQDLMIDLLVRSTKRFDGKTIGNQMALEACLKGNNIPPPPINSYTQLISLVHVMKKDCLPPILLFSINNSCQRQSKRVDSGNIYVFLQPELAFVSKKRFLEAFCLDSVREGLVVGFIHHLTATARSFATQSQNTPCPTLALLLILSKMCLEFESTSVNYLLKLTDEWFSIEENFGNSQGILTTESEICAGLRLAAQDLVNHYVRMQGLAISQMFRKSVETRDWLHILEPRTVRAVMKRVMEEMVTVETQVGMLFEEGSRAEQSSDSSRKTQSRQHRSITNASNWSSHSLAAAHIQKLFSERIEIFAPVQFSKVSILTGIIKISLKTLLECVRLRTFSKYGLQQMQVDTHYLQLYLWRFVADENLVHLLLDEILSSAVHRCLDPVLMEPSVVEIICERG